MMLSDDGDEACHIPLFKASWRWWKASKGVGSLSLLSYLQVLQAVDPFVIMGLSGQANGARRTCVSNLGGIAVINRPI